ncbi:hypothetical protein T4B_2787 [Trichinella pseudospiralis]|uniref:Uncharacterized protein n=1 Tax=Trichinella pseudospiralis TaxID=6337 RepID=A0A0V1IVA6_TRIPS|nr:hypothetical protein T4B_2787 [Trichinella pseudospiralis]
MSIAEVFINIKGRKGHLRIYSIKNETKAQFFYKCSWQQVEPQMTDATVRKPVEHYPLNTVFCGPIGSFMIMQRSYNEYNSTSQFHSHKAMPDDSRINRLIENYH